MLDRATGTPFLLSNRRYARAVRDALAQLQRELGLCTLRAWVILHNHIHAVLTPHGDVVRIGEAMMNASEMAVGRKFWQREAYARTLRDEQEIAAAVAFVEQHPVRSGLVARAADWEFSSAYRKRKGRKRAEGWAGFTTALCERPA